jgi:hypothetical protein
MASFPRWIGLLALLVPLGAGCGNGNTDASQAPFVRSDSAAIDTSWPTGMKIYAGSYLSEAELVRRFGFEGATRTTIVDSLNRYHYEGADGALEVFFDEGLDKPFHAVSYTRNAAPVGITWTSSAELHERWQEAATRAAAFVSHLTDLTPVVHVGAGTDAELAKALQDGFVFFLLLDRRLLFGTSSLKVDATGVYEMYVNEIPSAATPTRDIQARTRPEVDRLATQAALGSPLVIPGIPDPVFYFFDARATLELHPFFLFEQVRSVALDPGAAPFVRP